MVDEISNPILLASSLDIALHHINLWGYYDNYQHGDYVDENSVGYGPIKVFNATVEINGEEVFGGDVSDRRFDLLKRLAKQFGVGVRVYYESCRDTKTLYWTISKRGIPRLVDNRYPRKSKASKDEVKPGLAALFS